ncbi:MAG: hypothetical protein R3Y36_02715, partial [Spirochaetales bacterium]
MKKKTQKNLPLIVLQLAVALFLVASGILTVQLDGGFWGKLQAGISGNEIATAVYSFFDGDMANVVIMFLGICEIIAGAFLLINFFVNTGKITNLFVLIIMCLWILVIFLVDIAGKGGLLNGAFG